MEHLVLFGILKGCTSDAALREGRELLEAMGLSAKADSLVSTYSGGMKRKLCTAIALIAGSKTVFLDEPTSGESLPSVPSLLTYCRNGCGF